MGASRRPWRQPHLSAMPAHRFSRASLESLEARIDPRNCLAVCPASVTINLMGRIMTQSLRQSQNTIYIARWLPPGDESREDLMLRTSAILAVSLVVMAALPVAAL